MKSHDISLRLSDCLPTWPGDAPVRITTTKSIANGDKCNLSKIEMGAHAGTHLDAPSHFIKDGATVDSIPVEALIGPCLVIDPDSDLLIEKKDLLKFNLDGHSRILIKTRNSKKWADNIGSFDTDYVSLGIDAAQYLVEMKVVLVGIDYLSIESYGSDGAPVHKLLLKKNIVILEGLNLSGIKTGVYELICLPLRLEGCEGSPARAILREIS
ncbi:MAG: cyclase family protein [Nitrospirae bacterium]|nr:cyclase family protein [Nitrospirota bacterium]